MISPSSARKAARVACLAGWARKLGIMRAATPNAPAPLRRIRARAARPGGVARAAMGSESMDYSNSTIVPLDAWYPPTGQALRFTFAGLFAGERVFTSTIALAVR